MLPGHTASEQYGYRSQYEQVVMASVAALLFPGIFTQVRGVPFLLRGQLTVSQIGALYGPTILGVPTFTGMAIDYFLSRKKSPGQDMTLSGSPGRQIPKTLGGTKSSRVAGAAQTLKPFWSNGKPKCRKGYRYDFKRKMCVKKS
jgi:hypothetical protein